MNEALELSGVLKAKFTADTIRRLTEQDLDAVTALHRQTFPGYPNVLLGPRYVKSMLRWFAREPQGIALGVFDGSDRVVGYVIGAPVDLVKRLGRDLFFSAVRGFIMHPWLILHPRIRVTVWSRLVDRFVKAPAYEMPTIPPPCMGLFSIAVAGDAAGRGIGKRLMIAFEEESRRLKMSSMYLSVFPANAMARHVYERTGWTALPIPPRSGDAMHYVKELQTP
jgi:ribosomal protein S18 acetylase RimI-like enzyme